MRVVFASTCKGRATHIAETLPRNLADNPNSTFVLLDYGDGPDLRAVLEPLRCDRLKVFRHDNGGTFHTAHAKNMCARLAIREGADVVVTQDADNFTGPHFEDFVKANLQPGTFLCPDHESIRNLSWEPEDGRPCRGYAGRLAVRAQDFIKAGGYNELYDTWRGEDIDFNARMIRMGYQARFIPISYLNTIPHSAEVRFKEWPRARQFDKVGGWKINGTHTDTVVNYGQIGVGTAYKYGTCIRPGHRETKHHGIWHDNTCLGECVYPPIDLMPLPTRIFGIGLHKTATTSLHKAFQILGFDSLHWGSGEVPAIWEEVNAAGRSKTLERYYAASDLPIPLLYKKLDEAYPGSKFILTIRDEQKWLKSVERLWDSRYNATRWQWDVWPISNRLHKALYGRTDFNAETMLATYRKHNADVLEYFKDRRGDLLVLDIDLNATTLSTMGNANANLWFPLCFFLDKPLPAVSFPWEYKTRLHGEGSGI